MTDHSISNAEHAAVSLYLTALSAIADCIARMCPEIGGLYSNRLHRHRSRLAFDSSPQSLQQSCVEVQADLQECASRAAELIEQRVEALRSALSAQQRNARHLALQQDFHSTRLRQLAAKMGTSEVRVDVEDVQQVLALHAAGLLSYADNMKTEAESVLARIQEEFGAIECQIGQAEIIDPITGLMNRQEMERVIEARKRDQESPVVLQFRLVGAVSDEVARQVAARLSAMFRPQDIVSRWGDNEFVVLFQGTAGIAQARSERIVPWIAGPYLSDGKTVEISVEVWLMRPELVANAKSS